MMKSTQEIIIIHNENRGHTKFQVLNLGVAGKAVKCKECNKIVQRQGGDRLTLLDRLARDASLPDDERTTGHRAENALTLYFHDKVTRTQMINFFSIPVGMESDFDQFKTRYDSFSQNQAEERISYTEDVVACIGALQQGDITKAQFNTFTGLTLDAT